MDWLREKRKELGMTQDEVADLAGINRATLSKLETGEANPSVKLAQKLGLLLDFDWTRFYEEPTTPLPPSLEGVVDERGLTPSQRIEGPTPSIPLPRRGYRDTGATPSIPLQSRGQDKSKPSKEGVGDGRGLTPSLRETLHEVEETKE